MITLVLLLLAPILAALVILGAPIVVALAVLAVPVLAILGVLSLAAIGVGDLSGALAGLRAPSPQSLEVFGIAIGIVLALAALAYLISVGFLSTREPAIRRREEVIRVRERNIPETPRETATSLRGQDIPYDLAAQCQGQQLVPCPV
jgi:hypothetical protein